jgi:hypothetical protein
VIALILVCYAGTYPVIYESGELYPFFKIAFFIAASFVQNTTQQCTISVCFSRLPRFRSDLIQDGDFVHKANKLAG